jgi:uncharacterized protein YciU (UPF0263 family)
MKDALKKLFVIALALSALSCKSQQIIVGNYKFYGDKGKFGATEVESLHPEKPGVKIQKQEWDEKRIGMVCTDGANIADMQANIDKLCVKNKTACWYAKEELSELHSAFNSAKKAVAK